MSLEIVADFDGTLTLRGNGNATSYSVVDGVLGEEFLVAANRLYEKYAPIEIDFSLPVEERNKYMQEWWGEYFALIVQKGVTRSVLVEAARASTLNWREGIAEFFKLAKEHNIPVLILSAGLADIIEMKMRNDGFLSDNIIIVGNRFVFDEHDKIVDVVLPLIYAGNKNMIAQNIEAKVHQDTAILLGDHPSDAHMCEDANHKKVTRIGFLNEKIGQEEAFAAFDILHAKREASLFEVIPILQAEI